MVDEFTPIESESNGFTPIDDSTSTPVPEGALEPPRMSDVDASEVKRPFINLPTTIQKFSGFTSIPGQRVEEKPEGLFGAQWRSSIERNLFKVISNVVAPPKPTKDYDVFPDIPERHLNETYIPFYITSMSAKDAANRTMVLDNEERDIAIKEAHTWWQNMGAATLVSPITLLWPVGKGAQTVRAAYIGATKSSLRGSGAFSVSALAKGMKNSFVPVGLSTTAFVATQEALIQQTHLMKTEADSFHDILASGILGSAVGGLGGGIAVGVGVRAARSRIDARELARANRNAKSHIVNALADIPDTPAFIYKGPAEKGSLSADMVAISMENNKISRVPETLLKTMKGFDAYGMIDSPYPTTNFTSELLYTNPLQLVKNVKKDIASEPNLEDMIFASMGKLKKPMAKYDEIFREQLGVTGSFMSGMRARIAEKRKRGLNRDQFNEEAARELDSNVPSEHSSVNKAVQVVRDAMRPIKERLVEEGLLHPRFLEPKFDAYFHRMWLKHDIAENSIQFQKLLEAFYKKSRDFYVEHETTIQKLYEKPKATLAEIERVKKEIPSPGRNARLKLLREAYVKEMEPVYDFIPDEFIPMDGHIPSIKDEDFIPLDANQTVLRMLGTDVERKATATSGGPGSTNPLQSRALGMPSNFSIAIIDENGVSKTISAFDFIEKDIHKVMNNYARQTIPKLEGITQAKRYGFESQEELVKDLLHQLEADVDRAKAKTPNKIGKINRQHKKDKQMIERGFDVLNGINSGNISAYNAGFVQFLDSMRIWNQRTMLGSAAASSLTEVMVAPFRHGFNSAIVDWLIPMSERLVKLQQNKATKMNFQDAKNLGFGYNVELGKHMHSAMVKDKMLIRKAWWGKITEPIVSTFGNITGMNQVTDMTQNVAFSMSVSRSLRAIDKFVNTGKITERNRKWLRSLGMSENDMRAIHKTWREAVGTGGTHTGVYYSDLGKWNLGTAEGQAAYGVFERAMVKDVRSALTQASRGEKFHRSSDPMMRTILEFKDYLFASNTKITMSAVQKLGQGEVDAVLGLINIMAMGAFTYVLNSLARDPTGKSLDLSPEKLLRESIDRSGIFGIFMEGYNVLQKARIIKAPVNSRWATRGVVGGFLGPTFGRIDDLLAIAGDVSESGRGEKDMTVAKARAIMRILPYQNLFYIRYIFEQVFTGAAINLGARK